MLEITVLIISDINGFISKENIVSINKAEGSDYPELENTVTYQMLYDSREELGSQRGYFIKIEGVEFYVIPYIKGIVYVDPDSDVIKEYTEQEYISDIVPLCDDNEEL